MSLDSRLFVVDDCGQPIDQPVAKLSYQLTSDVLVEIMHERGRFHREPKADLPRLVDLIADGDRASLVRAGALIVARIEGMPA